MSLFGNWGLIPSYFFMMNSAVISAGERAKHKLATKAKKRWRSGILTQRFGLKPLHPATIKKKGSSTPLVDHKDMVNSITVQKTGSDWFAGINRTARRKKGDTSRELWNLAMIHEYGAPGRNIPARPHRQKTIEEVKSFYSDVVDKETLNAIRSFSP